jgi:hypothetical protein
MKKEMYMNIRVLLLVLLLSPAAGTVFAQDYYLIHTKDAGLVQRAGDAIDSVKVEDTALKFYTADNAVYTKALSQIDSVTFGPQKTIELTFPESITSTTHGTYGKFHEYPGVGIPLPDTLFRWNKIPGVSGYTFQISRSSGSDAQGNLNSAWRINLGDVDYYDMAGSNMKTLDSLLVAASATMWAPKWLFWKVKATNAESNISSETRNFYQARYWISATEMYAYAGNMGAHTNAQKISISETTPWLWVYEGRIDTCFAFKQRANTWATNWTFRPVLADIVKDEEGNYLDINGKIVQVLSARVDDGMYPGVYVPVESGKTYSTIRRSEQEAGNGPLVPDPETNLLHFNSFFGTKDTGVWRVTLDTRKQTYTFLRLQD